MTAEIAIMNREAVALAADSAVTVSGRKSCKSCGQKTYKIYNSDSKLFRLSEFAPVGVMTYGTADLTGVPWETIIKSFRRELGDERLPHLREYADRLIAYINGNKFMFSEELQESQLDNSVSVLFQMILDDTSIKSSNVRAIKMESARKIIQEVHSEWTSKERLAGIPASHAQRIRQKWQDRIENRIDSDFQELLPIDSETRGRLIDIACLLFTVDDFLLDDSSGVVVAGFGEEEYLPSVVSFDTEGFLLDFVKYKVNEEQSASFPPAAIIPFAQQDMVHHFIRGIHPLFWPKIRHELRQFTADLAAANAPCAEQIKQAGEALENQFVERLSAYSWEGHTWPVISAVEYLPKDELAVMAESLVNLTSFKYRVTQDAETVGGPIDVAVISKGDGFIWINRKNYFEPALNHHFFINHQRPYEIVPPKQ